MTANEILELRKRLGLTQTEMANRLGVTIQSVNRWERGHALPSQLARKQLARLEKRHRKQEGQE